MKKILIRLAALLVLAVILAVVLGFIFLDSLVKKGLETVGPYLTKTEFRIDAVKISAISGAGAIQGMFIGNPPGFKSESAVKVGAASIGVRPASLLSDKIHVTHVNVQGPEVTYEGTLKTSNLSKLLENVRTVAGGGSSTTAPAREQKAANRKLQVDSFIISGARVHLQVNLVGTRAATVVIPEINLSNLGQGADGITAAELTQRVLDELTRAALKAAAQLGSGTLKDATQSGSTVLPNTARSVTDLLNKK